MARFTRAIQQRWVSRAMRTLSQHRMSKFGYVALDYGLNAPRQGCATIENLIW